jgi:alpha-galactosidase
MDIDAIAWRSGRICAGKVAARWARIRRSRRRSDRREALRGADFVINMVQIGGFDSTLVDFEIPANTG